MFYVKSALKNGASIQIDIREDNVYTVCPKCGREHAVDIQEVLNDDGDLYCTQAFCMEAEQRKGGELKMDIQTEIIAYIDACADEENKTLKSRIGHDSWQKVRAILDILEIGKPNIAHSKLILYICENLLEKCSLTMGTITDT